MTDPAPAVPTPPETPHAPAAPQAPAAPPAAAPPRSAARRRARRALLALAAAAAAALAFEGVVALVAAATATRLDAAYGGPLPLPADVAARFDYPERGAPPEVVAEFAHTTLPGLTSRWVQVRVTTPGDTAAHNVQIIHLRPTGLSGPAPAVVISPILGGSYGLERLMGAALAARGLHAAIVLRAESLLVGDADEAHLERVLRTGVIDRRRALDWLATLPDVDPTRLGALGASTGGIGTTLLLAVEPRLQAGVILLAGGDLGAVLGTSEEGRVARWRAERLQATGLDEAGLTGRVRAAVPSDPLALARFVDARRVLVGLARFDVAVPWATQARLREALGGPESFTLPLGHQSSALALPVIVPRVVGFLEARLARRP